MTSGVPYTIEEAEAVKKKVLEYLVKTAGGTFAAACKYANIPFSTAYEWRQADTKWDADVVAARNAADDLGGDFAESKLMEAINNNVLTGIIFYLKTKHKHRGYIEKSEYDIGGQENNPVLVEQKNQLLEQDRLLMEKYLEQRNK